MNLGTKVRVKLTEKGVVKYSLTTGNKPEENLELPLWELMNIFGPYCTSSNADLFENNEILVVK